MNTKYPQIFWFFVLTIAVLFLRGGVADAASIKAVNKTRGIVIIDEGSDAGFKKGDRVCFQDINGKQVGCGTVASVKVSTANVQLANPRLARRLKRGMPAIQGASAFTASSPGKYRRNLKAMYIVTPLFPTSYQKLAYAPPPLTGNADSLWEQIGPPDISLLGFGVEAEFGIGASMSTAVGLRMRMDRVFVSEADFVTKAPDANTGQAVKITEYVETKQSTTSMGFWTDFYLYDLVFGSSFALRFGSGLDVDMSTVVLQATQKDDDPAAATIGEFAKVTSKLTTVSLRLLPAFVYFLDPIGINVTPALLIPLTATGASFAGESADTNAAKLNGDPVEDLKLALAHDKASFGLIVQFSLFYAF